MSIELQADRSGLEGCGYIRLQPVTCSRFHDISGIHRHLRIRFMPYLLQVGFLITSMKEIAMKLITGSFNKSELMTEMIAGSEMMAASFFALSAGTDSYKTGC